MERNANMTALHGDNPDLRDKTVKSTIGYSRNKNKTSKLSYNDGMKAAGDMINHERK